MVKNILLLATCMSGAAAVSAMQTVPSELEATIKVLDEAADLDASIEQELNPGIVAETAGSSDSHYDDYADDETDDDEESYEDEVEEKNAFSDLQDDFEHDDVDIDNRDDLIDEDDFEEDEEVDVEALLD